MPYILNKQRDEIDELLEPLISHIKYNLPMDEQDGVVNYAVTKLLKRVYSPLKYFTLNRALGVLSAISLEFYRRVVGPYEDIKIKENGDVL